MSKKPTQEMFVDDVEIVDDKEEKKLEPEAPVEAGSDGETGEAANLIELPSKGYHGYPEHVSYRDITVGDEEVLSTATESTFSRVLNGVVKSVLHDCDFYDTLTIYDREFLLVWLWANNYNPIKQIEVRCRHCEHVNERKIDLTKIDTTVAKEEVRKPFGIPLKKFPNKKIYVKIPTVKDEIAAEKYCEENPSTDMSRIRIISALDLGIPLPLAKKVDWVREHVSGKEFSYAKKYLEYFHYGISPNLDIECSSCKGVTKVAIPFSAKDIFYPDTVQDDFEELLRSQ